MTDTLSTASAAVGNAVRMGDPIIAEMVQIRRTAWIIRDRYGLQCSMLRPNVDRSVPLDARQLDLWHGDRAVYTAAWHTLDEFLLRPGVSTALRERIDVARAKTSQAQTRVDGIVGRFDRSGKPVVASAEWTALCDGPFAPFSPSPNKPRTKPTDMPRPSAPPRPECCSSQAST